jgi:hypothetical protein
MFMQDSARFTIAARMLPMSPFAAPVSSGLVAGTRVETETGWRAVETLRAGQRLYTQDGGLQPVLRVERSFLMPGCAARLLCLPGGSFGACADLRLLAGQHVLIDTRDPRPEAALALAPAAALDGIMGCMAISLDEVLEVVTPVFAEEEVIFANTGVRLVCPGLDAAAGWFPRLDAEAARAVLAEAQC